MNSVHIWSTIIFLFVLFNANTCTDPDEQLCTDLTIDAAVMVDNEQPTVFKGDYFWKFDIINGLSLQFGEKISNRWPGLPTPIDAAFSVDDAVHRNSTIFLKGDLWFHYKANKLIRNGTVKQWKFFDIPTPIDAVLTFKFYNSPYNKIPQYFFRGENYTSYSFEDTQNPWYQFTLRAWVNNSEFIFLRANKTLPKELMTMTIDQKIKVKAALSVPPYVVFFGYKTWCKAIIHSTWYKCEQVNSAKFFRCPRETRPVTIPLPTTKPPPTKPQPTAKATVHPSLTGITTDLSSVPPLIGSPGDSNGSHKNTTKKPGESKLRKDETKKSGSTLMFIIIILIVVIIFAAIIIAVVFIVIKNKKRDSFIETPVNRQDSTESISDPNDNIQRRVKKSESQESLASLVEKSKSKSNYDEDYENENKEKSGENLEEESKIKNEEKSDAENEDKNENKVKSEPKKVNDDIESSKTEEKE